MICKKKKKKKTFKTRKWQPVDFGGICIFKVIGWFGWFSLSLRESGRPSQLERFSIECVESN